MTFPGRAMRIATWNVWGNGPRWEIRLSALVHELRAAAADVITLQKFPRSDHEGLAAQLDLPFSAWWPYPWAAPSPEPTGGVLLLSRWPIGRQDSAELDTREARDNGGRIAAGGMVMHPEGPFVMIAAHLSSDPAGSAARCHEVRQLADLADKLRVVGPSRIPVVVAGDLNAEPDADEVRLLGGLLTRPAVPGLTLADAWRYAVEQPTGSGATWVARNPLLPWGTTDQRIDYVMSSAGLIPARAGLLGDGTEPDAPFWISTHCGVWADLVRSGAAPEI